MFSKVAAASQILKSAGEPMHINTIIETAIEKKMIETRGLTPASTLHADLLAERERRDRQGIEQRFVKVGPATWALTEWELSEQPTVKQRRTRKTPKS